MPNCAMTLRRGRSGIPAFDAETANAQNRDPTVGW
jgi:hypothetical protein